MIIKDIIVEDRIAGTQDQDEVIDYIFKNVPGCLRILGIYRDSAIGRTVAYVSVIESQGPVNITNIQRSAAE